MNNIINKETEMMQSIRDIIPQIVAVRLEAQRISKWLKEQDAELENANEEMNDAIESLTDAEKYMGNAHHHILVSQATLKHSRKAEK